ncbi:MAG: hypothetical protein IJW97_02925 [Clostridia bacterium]|nr:hypothetical protein [Clostridia bacterium]
MKRLLPLLVLMILSFLLLVGCNPSDTDPNDGAKPSDPEDMLILMENGAAQYRVVRSDKLNSNHVATKSAMQIISTVREMTGVEMEIATDYTGRGGTEEIACEILVGETERAESATAMEYLGDKDYAICVIGTKICIVAQNDRSLSAAVQKFFDQYLYYEEGRMFISKTLDVREMYIIPDNIWYEVAPSESNRITKYDESVAIACLQGIMNRESSHKVYLNYNGETQGWLNLFREEGYWLEDISFLKLTGFGELLELGIDYIKTVVIWDTDVPATLNVACTIAGVEDGVVMTESYYEKYKDMLAGKSITSLVGMFDGSETGSAKNDAYRWAIDNYLLTGKCSTDYICSYIDGWTYRASGNTSYTVVRDWGVYHRAFVYDLSPWGDEAPLDEPDQTPGLDKQTLLMIFDAMLELTEDKGPYEVCGFFEHQKYSKAGSNETSNHGSVATEWEYASLMTPYNGYHNTCIDAAYNESFHTLYTGAQQLVANRPKEDIELESGKVYLCYFMGDYDSTHPVYRYLKNAWDDPRRGEIPFAWAINPNLVETYPDLIEYYYNTATPNDYFVSDASAAGYFMPSQVPDALWPNMLKHNIEYFTRLDMSIAPMVLDNRLPDKDDLDMLVQFAPDGIGTVRQNQTFMHGTTPVTALLGGGYDRNDPEVGVKNLTNVINAQFSKSNSGASLCMLRCVWTTPSVICGTIDLYREANPDKEVVVVDIYNYFWLIQQDLDW